MRLDPDVAQELYEAAGQVRTRGVTAGEQRLARALHAAEANDEANRRVARAQYDEDWQGLVTEAIRASEGKAVAAQGRRVMEALEAAGVEFPQRDRRPAPQTIEEHLEEAARLLELSLTADGTLPGGYHVADDHCLAQVGAAEVHARIAHAATAALMLEAQGRAPSPSDAPGLAALERLAAAIERLAGEEGR